MTHYALLVRGINVGGKNKVVMAQLRQELTELGLEKVETYINSGNIFFTSTAPKAQLVEKLEAFFEIHYRFILEDLGFSGGNSLKNPTMQLPITSTCSRCLSTATSPFATQKPLTKSVKC